MTKHLPRLRAATFIAVLWAAVWLFACLLLFGALSLVTTLPPKEEVRVVLGKTTLFGWVAGYLFALVMVGNIDTDGPRYPTTKQGAAWGGLSGACLGISLHAILRTVFEWPAVSFLSAALSVLVGGLVGQGLGYLMISFSQRRGILIDQVSDGPALLSQDNEAGR